MVTPFLVAAGLLAMLPYLAAAFFPERAAGWVAGLPRWMRLVAPALLCLPYLLVSLSAHSFRWGWLGLYALLPVALAAVVDLGAGLGEGATQDWLNVLVLVLLGLAVDLRWFEPAWPEHLAVFGKVLLLDAGIYAFLWVRRLDGAGFDLRLRWRDVGIGLREFVLYAPIAVALGLGLGFLHWHGLWPSPLQLGEAYLFTFFLIAVPEEMFFRGWMQNLLERRMGRWVALAVTAVVFGLSHWNKRTTGFNWQYVLMAALAGIFYGRAWRAQRRVGASAITHATVDTVWSIWFR